MSEAKEEQLLGYLAEIRDIFKSDFDGMIGSGAINDPDMVVSFVKQQVKKLRKEIFYLESESAHKFHSEEVEDIKREHAKRVVKRVCTIIAGHKFIEQCHCCEDFMCPACKVREEFDIDKT